MRLDLDLEVDLLAHQEAARLDRHVPGHPPVLAIDRRLRRRGEHRLPLHVRPPPEELPREGDRPGDVLDREVAVQLEPRPPVGRTAVLLDVSTACLSTSRKSPFLRCWSRFSVCVV